MDSNWLPALSGVLGSLVGGSVSFATAWITQKAGSKRELRRDEMRKREMLYGEFIAECAKRLVDAFEHRLEKPDTLLPVYALISRIRISASRPVVLEAEHLLARIMEQYFSNPLTVDELRRLARAEQGDPMRGFGEACRAELKSLRGEL
jgi:hypothetical protein